MQSRTRAGEREREEWKRVGEREGKIEKGREFEERRSENKSELLVQP